MARSYAKVRTDMWGDDDWRTLSTGAQWLYMFLLSSASLTNVGVVDWRPARIAAKVGDADAAAIRARAGELEQGRFVFVDEQTEEVLIRSFLRHDGVLANPNMWKSIGGAFAELGSSRLRGILADEARRLRDEFSSGFVTAKGGIVNPWGSPHLATMLGTPSQTPPGTPQGTLPDTPSVEVAGRDCPPTPTPTPTPSSKELSTPPSSSPKSGTKRGTRISEHFQPSQADIDAIAEQCPGFNWKAIHPTFVDYWLAKPGAGGLKLDWGRTWRNWMRTDYQRRPQAERDAMKGTRPRKVFNDVDD